MPLVDHDTFLKHLRTLFESPEKHSSVWLTHKRLTHDGQDSAMKEGDDDSREYPCLVRLSDGGKYKYSTQVSSSELPKFHEAYGMLIKTSILGSLRKRDKKREKQRAEEAAKRKEKLSTPVVVDGKKRGAGRRRRQRQVKATIKQQAALQKVQERLDAKASASTKT